MVYKKYPNIFIYWCGRQGENEACKRHTLAADGVTTDTRGLQQLIAAGNYRAAVNLTAQLLEMYGQGKGKAGQLSKHSTTSLQG